MKINKLGYIICIFLVLLFAYSLLHDFYLYWFIYPLNYLQIYKFFVCFCFWKMSFVFLCCAILDIINIFTVACYQFNKSLKY